MVEASLKPLRTDRVDLNNALKVDLDEHLLPFRK
jgi:hypothetical protein